MYQYRYLIDHALTNTWCNPEQDNQLIFAGQRITKSTGVMNRFKLMHRTISLPTKGKYYHVFQIGQIHPNLVGLLGLDPTWVVEQWKCIKDIMNPMKLFCNVYTVDGVELPRFKVYYLYSNERDLVLAIEHDDNVKVDAGHEQIYLRLYTNAYFQSLRSDATNDAIIYKGMTITSTNEIVNLSNELVGYSTKPGYSYCYRNGYIVDNIDVSTTKIGDTVEYIHDSSIKRVVEFTVNNLDTFNSILDNKFKFLLHHLSTDVSTIDYFDDNDIYVLFCHMPNRYNGRYYHRNATDSVRMVTHRDYAMPVQYFNSIANKLLDDLSVKQVEAINCKIQIRIRKSGYDRPLVFDNNRIFEMYKLPLGSIEPVMMNLESSLEEWRAEVLENSAYTKLMRATCKEVNTGLIQEAYGYNAISKILADTPNRTSPVGGAVRAILPYGLIDASTVYEYDTDGYMKSWHNFTGYQYDTPDMTIKQVEAICGIGTDTPDVKFGIDNIDIPKHHSYRVYIQYRDIGTIPKWEDITGTNKYQIVGDKVVFTNPVATQLVMVRTDKTFLAYDLEIEDVSGTLFFTLSEYEYRDGIKQLYTLPVPLGELDIFLNGKSLINGLDYIVKFPMVYILNKKYLAHPVDTTRQKIHVRFTGFCHNPGLTMEEVDDFGFIEHGVLSNNNRFDVRDDKVLRITMDGALYNRDEVVFSELHSGISIVNAINGKPYQIKDIIVPLRDLVDENTYSLRAKSLVIDKHVSDYMTLKLPQPVRNGLSAITDRYQIVSPFFTHIILDMEAGTINDQDLIDTRSESDIIELCKPYEHLLEVDPINYLTPKLNKCVVVIPHPLDRVVNVKIYQYQVLVKLVEIYGNELIDLSAYVTLSAN
jgi:hypothetical protein